MIIRCQPKKTELSKICTEITRITYMSVLPLNKPDQRTKNVSYICIWLEKPEIGVTC